MMSSVGLDGQERLFEKPLTTTFLMFLAMAMSLPLYLFFYHRHYAKEDDKSHWKVRRDGRSQAGRRAGGSAA